MAFWKYGKKDDFSDIVLVVEGRKLHVNKTLLMMHSPVFKTMFTADFKEKDLEEIPLPGKKCYLMEALLDQIYPGNAVDKFGYKLLRDLLQLADEYGVQQVFHNCQAYFYRRLYGKNPLSDADEICIYLTVVEQWSRKYSQLISFKSALLERASGIDTSLLKRNISFSSLPDKLQKDILILRLERVEKELSTVNKRNNSTTT